MSILHQSLVYPIFPVLSSENGHDPIGFEPFYKHISAEITLRRYVMDIYI